MTPAEDIRVLFVRTAFSLSEVKNTLADAARILSYREDPSKHRADALSQCNRLANSLEIDPFASNRTNAFPNRILCNLGREGGNYYESVSADFLFFGVKSDVTQILASEVAEDYPSRIDAVDVGENTFKLWNWMQRLDDTYLTRYDYIWFMDGDMILSSLNWQGFWQQVAMFRPKMAQPATIGTSPGAVNTYHPVLRHQQDSRVLAAETALVEFGAPLMEVPTWLGFRDALSCVPKIMDDLQAGAENCLDVAWCHYARANLTGGQEVPPIRAEKRTAYADGSLAYPLNGNSSRSQFKERSCVVLYQTPLIHGNKKTMGKKSYKFRQVGAQLRHHLGMFQILDASSAARSVYDILVAS